MSYEPSDEAVEREARALHHWASGVISGVRLWSALSDYGRGHWRERARHTLRERYEAAVRAGQAVADELDVGDYHETFTQSLVRKAETTMFVEQAAARAVEPST